MLKCVYMMLGNVFLIRLPFFFSLARKILSIMGLSLRSHGEFHLWLGNAIINHRIDVTVAPEAAVGRSTG